MYRLRRHVRSAHGLQELPEWSRASDRAPHRSHRTHQQHRPYRPRHRQAHESHTNRQHQSSPVYTSHCTGPPSPPSAVDGIHNDNQEDWPFGDRDFRSQSTWAQRWTPTPSLGTEPDVQLWEESVSTPGLALAAAQPTSSSLVQRPLLRVLPTPDAHYEEDEAWDAASETSQSADPWGEAFEEAGEAPRRPQGRRTSTVAVFLVQLVTTEEVFY